MKKVKKFEFALLVGKEVIDTFISTLQEGFDKMHAEHKSRGKDVDLYYKHHHRFEKLSSSRMYRRSDEKESDSTKKSSNTASNR